MLNASVSSNRSQGKQMPLFSSSWLRMKNGVISRCICVLSDTHYRAKEIAEPSRGQHDVPWSPPPSKTKIKNLGKYWIVCFLWVEQFYDKCLLLFVIEKTVNMSSLDVTSRAACGEPDTILLDISTWTGVHLHSRSGKILISDRPQGTSSQLAQLYKMISDTFFSTLKLIICL